MAEYTLHLGKNYVAKLYLSAIESFASNETIKGTLIDLGFIDVKVSGSGQYRIANGFWVGGDVTTQLPPQIVEITEL